MEKFLVVLVLVIQRRMKSRHRPIHRGVTGSAVVCGTTQIPPPQHPVPPADPVSVYLHRNVHESMEMNQTLSVKSVIWISFYTHNSLLLFIYKYILFFIFFLPGCTFFAG